MTTDPAFVAPNRPSDGVRSYINGWWISEAEAKERTIGNEEWWKMEGIAGKTVPLKQYDSTGPEDKPIWMWDDVTMYLGEWTSYGPKGNAKMHGFGAFYSRTGKYQGKVYIGEWKAEKAHGSGRRLWLESAPCWKENKDPESDILENGTGRPYVYSGTYVNHSREDESATVTLKDGTTRVGPWRNGRPVGDWWKDHTLVVAATTQDACVSHIASVVKAEEPHTKTTPRTESGWQILALDDLGDSVTGEPGNEANVPDAAVALQGQATSEKEERVTKIIDWLVKTGYDPSQYEMAIYAGKLYEHGFHSVDMIINVCTKEDITGFDWIKPVHKRWITAALLDQD